MHELKTYSLHRRLLGWLLIPLLIMSGAILFEAYSTARESAREIYDRLLLGLALSISEHTVITEGDLLSEDMLGLITQSTQEKIYYKVTGPGNSFVTGYEGLPAIPIEEEIKGGIPVFYDAEYQGKAVRMVALSTYVDQLDLSGWLFVQVLQTKGERKAMVLESVGRSAIHLLVVLTIASVFTWIGISRGLKPLRLLEQAIRRRSSNDLRPVNKTVPKEIEHVVIAINNLFARIERHIDRTKTFVETASHQLRTPLAALKARTELAGREAKTEWGRNTLNTIHAETVKATRLTEQLLSLARIEPKALGEKTETGIDFSRLTADVARDWVGSALKKRIDIEYESAGELQEILVDGNKVLLCEMVSNLIDNAITYCHEGADILIRVGLHKPNTVYLEIEDNGPGIATEKRREVFERFVRLDYKDNRGCGLGLPIVKDIVAVHSGSIRLDSPANGTGLLVRIELPQSEQSESGNKSAKAK